MFWVSSFKSVSFEVLDCPGGCQIWCDLLAPPHVASRAYFVNHFKHSVTTKPSASAVSAQEIQWKPVGLETEVLVKPPQKAHVIRCGVFFFFTEMQTGLHRFERLELNRVSGNMWVTQLSRFRSISTTIHFWRPCFSEPSFMKVFTT